MDRLTEIALQLTKLSEQLNALVADMRPSFDLNLSNLNIYERALTHIIAREGKKLTVYLDTLGNPTVGVGHLVKPEDKLKVGDTVSASTAHDFLQADALTAFEAAQRQLVELGLDNSDFLVALTSVNFQLGTGWTRKFPRTWDLIKNKRYEEAAKEVAKSAWFTQTPARVKDFQEALHKLRSST